SGSTVAGRRLGSEEVVALEPDARLVIGSLALTVLAAPPAERPPLGAESPFAAAARAARAPLPAETVPLSAVAEALRREARPAAADEPQPIAGGTRLFIGANQGANQGADQGADQPAPRRTTRPRPIPQLEEAPAPRARGPLVAVGAIALAALVGGVATWAIVR